MMAIRRRTGHSVPSLDHRNIGIRGHVLYCRGTCTHFPSSAYSNCRFHQLLRPLPLDCNSKFSTHYSMSQGLPHQREKYPEEILSPLKFSTQQVFSLRIQQQVFVMPFLNQFLWCSRFISHFREYNYCNGK